MTRPAQATLEPREAWRRHVRIMTRTLQSMQKWRAREFDRLARASEAARPRRAGLGAQDDRSRDAS